MDQGVLRTAVSGDQRLQRTLDELAFLVYCLQADSVDNFGDGVGARPPSNVPNVVPQAGPVKKVQKVAHQGGPAKTGLAQALPQQVHKEASKGRQWGRVPKRK